MVFVLQQYQLFQKNRQLKNLFFGNNQRKKFSRFLVENIKYVCFLYKIAFANRPEIIF